MSSASTVRVSVALDPSDPTCPAWSHGLPCIALDLAHTAYGFHPVRMDMEERSDPPIVRVTFPAEP